MSETEEVVEKEEIKVKIKGEDDSSPANKRKRWYKQAFKKEWVDDARYKNWLRPNPKDKFTAYCLICESGLKNANRSGIKKHSECTKHLKNEEKHRACTEDIQEPHADMYHGTEEDIKEANQRNLNDSFMGESDNIQSAPISVIISDPAYAAAQGVTGTIAPAPQPFTYFKPKNKQIIDFSQLESSKVQREDEGCDIFGRYVSSQLKKLPIKEMLEAQVEIQQLLIQKRLSLIN